MSWTASKIFRPYLADSLANTAPLDLGGAGVDTFKAALYNDAITPNQDVTSALSAYNAGVWVSASNEMYSAGQWAAGGVALASPVIDSATAATVFFDATDTASGATATLATVFGCLVYDTTSATVTNQGICFNYFGGTQGVTGGTFTIVWHGQGLFRFTL